MAERVTSFHSALSIYKRGLERKDASAEYNIWGNLPGFLPFGLLLPAGMLLSLGYETSQLLTRPGVWDVDDLLLNTAGVR